MVGERARQPATVAPAFLMVFLRCKRWDPACLSSAAVWGVGLGRGPPGTSAGPAAVVPRETSEPSADDMREKAHRAGIVR